MTNTLDDLIVGIQSYVVAPLNIFGMGGLVFDVAGKARAQLSADITDHYSEDNKALQDHIAIRPKRITLEGFVGEVVYTTESTSSNILQKAVQKLTAVSAYLPTLSASVQQAQAVLANPTNSDLTLISAAGQLPGAANIYALVKNFLGSTGNTSKQQAAYNYFDACRQQGILMGIQTPWEFLTNMAVESVDAIQGDESIFVTDFAVTFKQIRIAQTKQANNPLTGSGGQVNGQTFSQTVAELQGAAQTSQGIVPGATLPTTLLSGLGPVSGIRGVSSVKDTPGLSNYFVLR